MKTPKESSPAPLDNAARKRHRWKPGTVALREIRSQQKKTTSLIPKAAFERLVREILQEINPEARVQPAAVQALQDAAEMHAIGILQQAQTYAVHADRVTLSKDDLQLAIDQIDVEPQQRAVQ